MYASSFLVHVVNLVKPVRLDVCVMDVLTFAAEGPTLWSFVWVF